MSTTRCPLTHSLTHSLVPPLTSAEKKLKVFCSLRARERWRESMLGQKHTNAHGIRRARARSGPSRRDVRYIAEFQHEARAPATTSSHKLVQGFAFLHHSRVELRRAQIAAAVALLGGGNFRRSVAGVATLWRHSDEPQTKGKCVRSLVCSYRICSHRPKFSSLELQDKRSFGVPLALLRLQLQQ